MHLQPRVVIAGAVIVAALAVIALALPDWGAMGAWLGAHAGWTLQVLFLAVAAVLVCVAFSLLQSTVLDPLLVGPEACRAFLLWWHAWLKGERSDQDGLFMLSGAILTLASSILFGLLAFAVFYAGSAL